ncbi:MAG: HK97 gp10 family phage protein [Eubacteriales bacterium]|nr:HK97 gp10 family phage protein [Eubacteriales bacterium]
MSKVGFDFSELEGLEHDLRRIAKHDGEIRKASERVLNKLAKTVLAATKSNTPVRSGALRRNWQRTPVKVDVFRDEVSVKIYNITEYAPYVEYGHRIVVNGITVGFADGVLMLTTAVKDAEKILPEMVEEQIIAALERIGK